MLPKFKVGDRVYCVFIAGEHGTVVGVSDDTYRIKSPVTNKIYEIRKHFCHWPETPE